MNAYTRKYLLSGLAAGPEILDGLLTGLTSVQADFRPDPNRFTIREAIAHMADFEPVWHGRIQRILSENEPMLENLDEDAMAIENRYAESDVFERAERFRSDRALLIRTLEPLTPDQWERVGRHSAWKSMSVADLATLVLGHDGYHFRQVVDQRKGTN